MRNCQELRMRINNLIFFYLFSIILFAQKGKFLDREIQIEIDNDLFAFNFMIEQYYSSGVYGKYRVVDTTGFRKKIKWIGLNHRIFTTKGIKSMRVENFDRPYAGQFSVSSGVAFYHDIFFYELSLEGGVTGPLAIGGPIQREWHKFLRIPIPQGWDFQIQNGLLLNGQFKMAHRIIKAGNIQILGEGHATLGTANTFLRPEIMLQLGKFKDLDQSAQYSANLGYRQKKSKHTVETILFVAYGPEYVLFNSTIEGNLIGKSSVHTEEIENLVHQFRLGIICSWSSFDLGFIYYRRSVETVGALNHRYAGIRLSRRF